MLEMKSVGKKKTFNKRRSEPSSPLLNKSIDVENSETTENTFPILNNKKAKKRKSASDSPLLASSPTGINDSPKKQETVDNDLKIQKNKKAKKRKSAPVSPLPASMPAAIIDSPKLENVESNLTLQNIKKVKKRKSISDSPVPTSLPTAISDLPEDSEIIENNSPIQNFKKAKKNISASDSPLPSSPMGLSDRKSPEETTKNAKNNSKLPFLTKNVKLEPIKDSLVEKKKKNKKLKSESGSPLVTEGAKMESKAISSLAHENNGLQKEVTFEEPSVEEIGAKYPVLKDEELIKKFMSVSLSGNQKGRIRQELQSKLKRVTSSIHPDAIHNSILAILRCNTDLKDAQLRRIRILYNMLKVAIVAEKNGTLKKPMEEKEVEKGKSKKNENKENVTEGKNAEKEQGRKVKGKKRYVVFLGNLPLDVTKDMIMQHFVEMNEHIINIRIPKPKENRPEKKKAMAYVELRNEPTYELALSKHHSMMGSHRIKVLYTTQKNSKVTKSDAKRKSAKLIALQKSGMLIGSTPFHKKRSQRRLKLKQARLKEEREYGL